MAKLDPFASLRDWRISLYRGKEVVIDKFFDAIDSNLLPGWTHEPEQEPGRSQRDPIRSYTGGGAEEPVIVLYLRRVSPTRVRGGPVQVLRHPPSGESERIGRLVGEFFDGCVLAATNSAGVLHTRPAFGPRTSITGHAELMFTLFADRADGEWPLSGWLHDSWDDLITGCLTEQVGIDRAELTQWFADSGWERSIVSEIVDRFFARSAWWANRLAAMTP